MSPRRNDTPHHQLAPEIALLIRILDESYERKAWHGPNLKGSIRGLAPDRAAWRPQPGRHSIAEHVIHAAYWKYAVRRRLEGGTRGAFPLKGSNWFAVLDSLSQSRVEKPRRAPGIGASRPPRDDPCPSRGTTGRGPAGREAAQRDDDLGDRIPRRLPRGADPVAETASGGNRGSRGPLSSWAQPPAVLVIGVSRAGQTGCDVFSPVSSSLTSHSRPAAASSCAAAEEFTGFCFAKYLPVTPSISGAVAR